MYRCSEKQTQVLRTQQKKKNLKILEHQHEQ